MDRQKAINILQKYMNDPIAANIWEAHAMAIDALINEEDEYVSTRWWTLDEKEPLHGEICMVAVENNRRDEVDTGYYRAVYFRRGETYENYDGTVEVAKKSTFYVPMDPRPLGLYWGQLRPSNKSIIAWQINDAPYKPKEHEKWGTDYCNYESEGIKNDV